MIAITVVMLLGTDVAGQARIPVSWGANISPFKGSMVSICANCGRERASVADAKKRCSCIPKGFWDAPEAQEAAGRLDAGSLVPIDVRDADLIRLAFAPGALRRRQVVVGAEGGGVDQQRRGRVPTIQSPQRCLRIAAGA